ncbi:MAG: DegT/DnrJ/EryC1/StrS family aminotransferase [Synechococcales cyanobacterium CRU_2_2]|nr:DegT/DnrJ/EryC1/StrS family aminotransferase [Synechococcales cyanobacterium CRU_2_2]
MVNTVDSKKTFLMLPSDQDASGRTLGHEEIELVSDAIRSGTLTSTKGTYVKALEQKFAALIGVQYAYACASGSAAVHVAVAAVDPEPGDEVITTSITDMGALAPILYQGAVPVFVDVDPRTWNVTAETIEKAISDRTKAIIVTHLFGNPCEMTEIIALGKRHGIPVIEDTAQSFLATHNGQVVGGIGDIGCFSFQQGKHITAGEGGMVTTNDAAFARRMELFINKAWGYGDPKPDHYFLAPNYRLTELQGAVLVAQLAKLKPVVARRQATAQQLTNKIADLTGIQTPWIGDRNTHVFWKYCLRVDSSVIPGGAVALATWLKDNYGIFSAPRYIQKPAFRCQVFQEQRTFGDSRFPFDRARPEVLDYSEAKFPGTYQGLEEVLVLPWNEAYTEQHINYIADALMDAIDHLNTSNFN